MGLLKETMLELMRNLHQNIADKMAAESDPVSAKRALEIILSCNFDETTNRSAMKVVILLGNEYAPAGVTPFTKN